MKLKQLTISNIASIEHAVINFDAAPLDNEHLFLITGETGSGKSTIIDCICLALYGNTPRLEGARKDEYTSLIGHEGAVEESLKTDDVRQLLRRGAVSADVRLTFDDDEGIPYIATWHTHRSRNKIDGAIQKPIRVIETDETVAQHKQYTKQAELKDFAKQAIGLDMNEFFRTVVLAQGKFAEFLNSDENDKAALLERMTGTEVYAQVGSRIYEECRLKEMERDALRDQLQGIVLLSEVEKEQINNDLTSHNQAQAEWAKQSEAARQMMQWLDERDHNSQELERQQQSLASQLAHTREPQYVEQQQLVADWDATIDPRRELREKRTAQGLLQALQDQRPAMQEEFSSLCCALRAAQAKLATQRNELETAQQFLQQESLDSEMYKAIKAIKTLLKQRQGEQDNITAFTTALHQEEEREPAAKANVQHTHEALQQQQQLVKQLESEYEKMNVTGINRQKDALNEAKQALTALIAANDAVTQATARLDNLKADRDKEQITLNKLEAVIKDKLTIVEQARAAVERETDWNNLLQQAHKTLHQGDTCPVCGNVIDNLLAPMGENVLEELRQKSLAAETDANTTAANIAASGKAIKRIDRQIAEAQKEIAGLTQACHQQQELTIAKLNRCGKSGDSVSSSSQVQELVASLNGEIEELNCLLSQATTVNNRIGDERNRLSRAIEAHNKALMNHNHIIESIKHQQEVIKRSTHAVSAFTRDLDRLFTVADWQVRIDQQDGFIEELERKAARYQRVADDATRLKQEIGIAQSIIPGMEAARQNIVGLEDNGATGKTVPKHLDDLWRQFENKSINWNNQLEQQRNKIQATQEALDNYLNAHPSITIERLALLDSLDTGAIEGMRQQHKQLADSITHMQGAISTLLAQQEAIALKKPAYHEENREKLEAIQATCQEQLKELNELITELNTRLKLDEANHKAVGEKKTALDQADAVLQKWTELKEMLGDAKGAKFRKIAQSYILGELLHRANGYLRQFNDRYELEAHPGTLIILVRDLLQGDRTSVNTLSGGESFMVSLALALALSSASGRMFSVDTLFIDEGFGSLSEKYLDNVMETLNRLYDMGGRRVGIISHVEMLKERVSTQIQVERDPGNNTVSRVTVTS